MIRDYLGDALDHFKGSLLRYLQKERLLRNLAADPMVTEEWTPAEYGLYADLIGVGNTRVGEPDETLDARGRRGLGPPNHKGDLFLDPDIGIRTGHRTPMRCYVCPGEIHGLLVASGGIVAVYQHAWHMKRDGWVARTGNVVLGREPSRWATAYASTQVAVLFFSLDAARIRDLDSSLRCWLGPRAEACICSLHVAPVE